MSVAPLAQALQQLVEAGGSGNRLVIARGPAWFYCSAGHGDRSILVEAAPSSVLPKARALSPNRVSALRQAGFAKRPGHTCLGRHVALDEPLAIDMLAKELLALFESVYQEAEGETSLTSHGGDLEQTANPKLIEAMRLMAKKRDHKLRTSLYRSLLDSKLLLLLTDTTSETPLKVGELMRFDVYAAFTSWDALRRFEPRGGAYAVIRGRRLFGRLLQHNVGSLLIDPKSSVGGELYRNELETLAEASHGTRRH
jgi:hypothetical protein